MKICCIRKSKPYLAHKGRRGDFLFIMMLLWGSFTENVFGKTDTHWHFKRKIFVRFFQTPHRVSRSFVISKYIKRLKISGKFKEVKVVQLWEKSHTCNRKTSCVVLYDTSSYVCIYKPVLYTPWIRKKESTWNLILLIWAQIQMIKIILAELLTTLKKRLSHIIPFRQKLQSQLSIIYKEINRITEFLRKTLIKYFFNKKILLKLIVHSDMFQFVSTQQLKRSYYRVQGPKKYG